MIPVSTGSFRDGSTLFAWLVNGRTPTAARDLCEQFVQALGFAQIQ